ncbi:MAG: hypothetical protein F4X98_01205 [Gammaproteobacteria bacterium]|nr:hypothetical protein [Gammaproteobacteria bacterium]
MDQDSLPTIAANPEDAGRYGRGGRGRSRRSSSGSLVVNAVLVVLIAGLAGAGWFIFNQQEQLDRASVALAEAADRLGVLETRLRVTDEAMANSDTDITAKLTEWISEVDKLWANYRRHRDDIADLDKETKALTAALNRVDGSAKNNASKIASMDAVLARQRDVADKVTALDMQSRRLTNDLQDAVDKANSAFQMASSLQASLATKVADNETAIRAIDAHRTQVNNDLATLRRDVDALRLRVP